MIGPLQIGCLTAGEVETGRIAQRIHQGVDFGAQPAARASDRLVLADFWGAPAPC